MCWQKRRRPLAAVVVVALFGIGVAACSSTSSPPTTTTTAPTTTTTVPLPPLAQATAAIKQSYGVLFDLSNPQLTPKLAVVQGGQSLETAMTNALESSLAKEATGATVSKVVLAEGSACSKQGVPSPCAKVTYNILGPKNAVVLSNQPGLAIYVQTRWLVAKSTICGLLYLENAGVMPVGCSS
jgi:hypothetical protein